MENQTHAGEMSSVPRRLVPSVQCVTALFGRHRVRLMLYGVGVLLWALPLQMTLAGRLGTGVFAAVAGFALLAALYVFTAMVGFRLLYNWEHGITPWWRIGASRLIVPVLGITLLLQLILYAMLGILFVLLGSLGLATAIPAISNKVAFVSGAVFWVHVLVVIVLLIIAPRLIPWIPLASLRQLGPVAAMKRSWALTFDSWWFTVGLVLFHTVVSGLIGAVPWALGVGADTLLSSTGTGMWWLLVVTSAVVVAVAIALLLPVGYVLVDSLEARETARLKQLRPASRQYDGR